MDKHNRNRGASLVLLLSEKLRLPATLFLVEFCNVCKTKRFHAQTHLVQFIQVLVHLACLVWIVLVCYDNWSRPEFK